MGYLTVFRDVYDYGVADSYTETYGYGVGGSFLSPMAMG